MKPISEIPEHEYLPERDEIETTHDIAFDVLMGVCGAVFVGVIAAAVWLKVTV